MCEQLPNKGKTPFCHLKLHGGGGLGGRSTGGQGEADNTGSRIKREMLSDRNRKMSKREYCVSNIYISCCAIPEH